MQKNSNQEKTEKLKHLNLQLSKCNKCRNCINDKKIFGVGNPNSKIVIIGEGPGQNEYDLGIPFIGESGKLLNKALEGIHIKREEIYITNSLLCRTGKDNRTPTPEEINNCKERLFSELLIIKPLVCLLLGSTALKVFFNDEYSILKIHGRWLTTISEPCYFFFPTVHPSYILHSSTPGETNAKKTLLWKDLIKFKTELDIFKDFNI